MALEQGLEGHPVRNFGGNTGILAESASFSFRAPGPAALIQVIAACKTAA